MSADSRLYPKAIFIKIITNEINILLKRLPGERNVRPMDDRLTELAQQMYEHKQARINLLHRHYIEDL